MSSTRSTVEACDTAYTKLDRDFGEEYKRLWMCLRKLLRVAIAAKFMKRQRTAIERENMKRLRAAKRPQVSQLQDLFNETGKRKRSVVIDDDEVDFIQEATAHEPTLDEAVINEVDIEAMESAVNEGDMWRVACSANECTGNLILYI